MGKKSQQKTTVLKENQINNYEDLFQLWKDLPVIKKLSDQSLFQALKDPIRNSILRILREGIIDKNGRKRNYLIANELLEHVNKDIEELDKSIKSSMLYYHLDKLQESNLINFVYYVEGRHKRKYFGRTSKFYFFQIDEEKEKFMEKFFSPISKLISHFRPESKIEQFKELVTKIDTEQSELSDSVIEWIERNHELLFELDIDALELYESFNTILIGQNSLKQLFSPLLKHMKFLETK